MDKLIMNDFFTIQSMQPENRSDNMLVEIKLNKDHPVFAGHFPQHPVVPGVFMIQTILEITTKICQCELTIKELSSVKFLSLIDPAIHQDIKVTVEILEEDTKSCRINSTVFSEDMQFLKCKGRFLKSSDG